MADGTGITEPKMNIDARLECFRAVDKLMFAANALTGVALVSDEEFVEAVHDIEDALNNLRPFQRQAFERLGVEDKADTTPVCTQWYSMTLDMACGDCGHTWKQEVPCGLGVDTKMPEDPCPECVGPSWVTNVHLHVAPLPWYTYRRGLAFQ